MNYKIYTYGCPVLREKADPVENINESIVKLSSDMQSVLLNEKGLGLAAQQIGQTISICVLDLPSEYDVIEPGGPRLNPDITTPLTLINPVIVAKSGAIKRDEGCLSFPKLYSAVQRAWETSVTYVDISGTERKMEARGLLARIIQHELDHLNGVLFVDKISKIAKIGMSAKLKALKKRALEEKK